MKKLLCLLGIHDWRGCTCFRCGKKRDIYHSFKGCTCERCGAVRHSYMVVEQKDSIPDCVFASGEPCTGPGCCENYPGPGTRWERLRCSVCGHETERKYDIGNPFVQYYPPTKDE